MKKYLMTCLLVFTPVFMFLIFGPSEIFFGNYKELGFVYGEFGWTFIGAGIGVTLVLALLLSLLPDALHKGALAAAFGLTVASYLQTMFLNKGLDQIGVTAEGYVPEMGKIIGNAVIWFVIFAIAFVLAYHKKVNAKKIFCMVSGILLATQMVGFATLFLTVEDTAFAYQEEQEGQKEGKLGLSMAEQFTVSSKENVIILLFDNVPNDWLDCTVEVYPELLECVKDFTYYTNADCNYYGTYPSAVHILTGNPLDTSLGVRDYIRKSWDNESTNAYYQFLQDKNYKVNVFMNLEEDLIADHPLEILKGKLSNVTEIKEHTQINHALLYKTMLQMSCYRYMPDGLKPLFNVNNEQYAGIITYPENEKLYANPEYYAALLQQGLQVDDESNYLIVKHFNGTHEFINDENCKRVESATMEQTMKGMFLLIEEYLQQLQDVDAYDNSTVIIMADHGTGYNAQPIFFIKQKNETHEVVQRTNAPITYDELIPTIVEVLGGDASKFGNTIFDYKEDEQRERVFYERAYDASYPDVIKYDGSRGGGANIWKKYTYTGDKWTIWSVYESEIYEIVPMVDSYY